MTKSLLETLKEARRWLIEIGWCQGAYVKGVFGTLAKGEAKEFCLVGSVLCQLDSSDPDSIALGDQARDLLAKAANEEISLSMWNDAAHRKKEDVIHLLEKVIATLEEVKV